MITRITITSRYFGVQFLKTDVLKCLIVFLNQILIIFTQPQIYSKSKAQRTYFDGGPGCFGDSGGPLWREVYDEKSGKKVPVIVGVFSFLLWGTCHGAQSPKYYGKVAPITDWIKQYVPENQICEYSKDLKDSRKLCNFSR